MSEISGQELVEGREDVIEKLCDHFKDVSKERQDSFVNRVGLGAIKSGHVERAKAAFGNSNGSQQSH